MNRSQLVLEHIARAAAAPRGVKPGLRVVTRTLPVSFDRLERALDRALSSHPDAVLLLGESGSAQELRLERVAMNRIDARLPDNDGHQPQAERVVENGPAAYFSSLPLAPALDCVRRTGAPAEISSDAGLFACNAAYYLALHRLTGRGEGGSPVLFVHIPVRSRALALRDATRSVLALLRHLGERIEGRKRPPTRRRSPTRRVPATPAGGRKA